MSDFLFARPSVLEGIGRNVDLFGVMQDYNRTENPDENAILMDIAVLKKDMAIAISKVLPGNA